MKTIRRYGLSTKGSIDTDEDSPLVTRRGLGVPSKFTDTKGRRNTRLVLHLLGILCFAVHVLLLSAVILNHIAPALGIASDRPNTSLMIAIIIMCGHVGFVMEIAADIDGKGWFARSVGLFWFSIMGVFALAGVWELITRIFS